MAQESDSPHGHDMTAGTEVAHGGGEGGLPQLQFEHWGGQILWLLILFAIFYFLVSRVFTPRLRNVIDLRAQTITDAITAARNVQNEADAQAKTATREVAEARANAQKIASDARSRAKAEAAEREAKVEAQLAERLAKAEAEIRAARDTAMASVSGIAADTAKALVAKLVGTAPADAETRSAVAKAQG